jgi:hypothetical protein
MFLCESKKENIVATMYGLRNKKTGNIVSYETSRNDDGDCCVSTQYILDTYPTNDVSKYWMVSDPYQAEWVRLNSTEWYNADIETPTHPSKWVSDDYEVVTVEVVVKVDPVDVKLPTVEEYLKAKYETSDPSHYNHCIKALRDGMLSVSSYDMVGYAKRGQAK